VTPYETACAAIDRANGDDPRAHELPYSQRMVEWTKKLSPEASDELLLAVRAQHVRRWTVPRASYPEGRSGYLQWREALKKFHADTLAAILKDAGFAEPAIAKAKSLILRKNLASDPEGQTLEDAACLVFLQHEFAEFAAKTPDEKVVDILRKTWKKMSPRARDFALGLAFPERETSILRKALGHPA
jgi:uncharacterized protein DUF4202